MNEKNRNKLSKVLGVDYSEIPEPSDIIMSKLTESSFDDDESSNNSPEPPSDYNNLEYDSYYDLRVLYDNWSEFENLCKCFSEIIPELLKNTDSIQHVFLSNKNDEIRSKSPIEDKFKNALRKLVKYKNEPWVIEISRILTNALRGVETTMNRMKLSLDVNEREDLYIELAYGIIINIILETHENMGDCEINRLCYFKCAKCNEETTYLFNEKEHRDICAICWNSNK